MKNFIGRHSIRLSAHLTLSLAACLMIQLSAKAIEKENAKMSDTLPDLYDIWDYNDAAGTRAKFEAILPEAEKSADTSYYLQLLTQIARTYGLEANFAGAHELLDKVEAGLTDELQIVRVRYLLERGRTFRSTGLAGKSLPFFVESYELSIELGADFYTVDAAHMVAIAEKAPEVKEKWNLIGVEVAENSDDPRASKWLGSLYNNIGWDYHSQKEYEKSLSMFEKALAFQRERGNSETIGIARWCIAKTYRFLGRIYDALQIQLELLEEHEKNGSSDGYVFEELGELYLIKKDSAKYAEYFSRAYEALSKDIWLVKNESERLDRLRALGAIKD